MSDSLDEGLVQRVDACGTTPWSRECHRYTTAHRDALSGEGAPTSDPHPTSNPFSPKQIAYDTHHARTQILDWDRTRERNQEQGIDHDISF